MSEEKNFFDEKQASANKVMLRCYQIIVVILLAAYLVEVIKGSRTIPYYLLIFAMGVIPVSVSTFIYKLRPDNKKMQHIAALCYGLMYVVMIFTSDNPLAFVYALPMLACISVYNQSGFTLRIGSAITIINIIYVIVEYSPDGFTAVESAMSEIQVIVVGLITAYSVYATKVSSRLVQQDVDKVEKEMLRSEELLNKILVVSDDMTSEIDVVNGAVGELGASITETRGAMEDLATGAADTADAVQDQLIQTEAIAGKVEEVRNTTVDINENTRQTLEAIESGNDNVRQLLEQGELTNRTNEIITKELKTLEEYTTQMFSIIEIINSITSQTSLLSLNASIEAARAGEAGRGFAVVASEISGLASQTQEATVNIDGLIKSVSAEIENVVKIMADMVEQVSRQNEVVSDTARSFEKIEINAGNIQHSSEVLTSMVDELTEANNVISGSIQTISAISEEVVAQTNETRKSCEANEQTIESIVVQADILKGLADRLQSES